MGEDNVLILKGSEVAELLAHREAEILEAVRQAYVTHSRGDSSLPQSIFLRFPGDDLNRIIGLPAFLGDGFGVAGMKWIASFPGNVKHGMARASAVLILNSRETGRPEAILESSLISAKRTAASAALAAAELHRGPVPETVGLIGTGVINLEVARFLLAVMPGLRRFLLFDLDRERAGRFGDRLRAIHAGAEVAAASDVAEVLRACPLVSFATTAIRPYLADLSMCPPGATLLHVSLRDLTPEAILACDNVVDDVEHVLRAQTSVHLAEQLTGSRDFVRCTLADVLQGQAPPRRDETSISVFSPFGLGVLDLAVGKLALDRGRATGLGTAISPFFPEDESF
ncbi:MAG TPA: 2,3-diaminopropionate biosynthesis protein SbnB [Thermoanaerobaculia bacterium]|jgi:ornithine cyclodeaminase